MSFFNEKNMKKIHARVNLDHPAPSKSSQKYLKKKLRLGIIIPNQKKTTPEKNGYWSRAQLPYYLD